MKKFIAFLVLALLIAAGPSFALSCKEGNYGSDECWTNVRVSALETTPVIAGTLLMYDFTDDNADDAAYQVRVTSASTDSYKVAGVAQSTIATGDRGVVLVRGQGQLRIASGTASGDRLFASSTAGAAGRHAAGATLASHDSVIGFALESTSGAATADAFITIV